MRRGGRTAVLSAAIAALVVSAAGASVYSHPRLISQGSATSRSTSVRTYLQPAPAAADTRAGTHRAGQVRTAPQPPSTLTNAGGIRSSATATVPVPARPHYPVQVIGHRGAPSYRPPHTLEGYQLAIDQGADFIEPDLVVTLDGALIARHEHDLTDTTDVQEHPELALLARDGRWYSEDLTLAQVRTLHARGGPTEYSGKFAVPTLDDVIALLQRQKRQVGLYVEMKEPAYFRSIGLAEEDRLAATLRANGWTSPSAPVYVESLDAEALQRIHGLTGVRLTQLIFGGVDTVPITAEKLATISGYATAVGVDRDRFAGQLTALASGGAAPPPDANPVAPVQTNLVALARSNRLAVHVFTLNGRNPYGPLQAGLAHPADPAPWAAAIPLYRALYGLGVEAVFTDTPDIAVYARG